MVRIKPPFDGSAVAPLEFEDFYDGPQPKPGVYHGYVKRMLLTKYKSGEREGSDRIAALVVIDQGPYKGAGIWHSLSYGDDKSAGWMNNFLHALAGDDKKAQGAIRKAFWETGFDAGDEEGGRRPITKLGRYKPGQSMTVTFKTKLRDYNGEPTAAIQRFLVPVHTPDTNGAEPEDPLKDMAEPDAPSFREPAPRDEDDFVPVEGEGSDLGDPFESSEPWT